MSTTQKQGQTTIQKPQEAAVFQSPFGGNTDALQLLDKAKSLTGVVRIIHGAHDEVYSNLEGKTIGKIRKSLREALSLPGDAVATVGGKIVNDDHIVALGDTLEFYKEAGTKGR